MSDNVIKSTDIVEEKENKSPVKKAPAKKTAVKKETAEKKEGHVVIVFDSGFGYSSSECSFSYENRVQEVSSELAEKLLQLENFRLANQLEIEDFLQAKGE